MAEINDWEDITDWQEIEADQPKPSLWQQGMQMGMEATRNTPMGVVASGMDIAQKGADIVGEKGAEELAKQGMNPYVAAGVGTAAQMTPPILASLMPFEKASMVAKTAQEASPMAQKASQLATDARIRGFRVPGTAIDKPGELGAMRESVETLKAQGIEPKIMESAEDLAQRVKSGIGEYGQAVREIPKALDKAGIKPRLNDKTLPEFLRTKLAPTHAEGAYAEEARIAQEIADTAKGHSDSFGSLLDLKQKFADQGKFYRVNMGEPGAPMKAEMYQKAWGEVNNILKNEINQVAPQFSEAWAQANKIYGAGKDVLPHLTTEAGKAAARSISDIHGLTKAASRKIISPATAYGADFVAEVLKKTPEVFGKFTKNLQEAAVKGQLAAANYVLQQRNPEYAEIIKNLSETEAAPNEE